MDVTIRRARTSDVRAIRALVDTYVADRRLLSKPTVALYERTLTTLEPRGTATTGEDGRFLFTGRRLHHFVLEARKERVGTAPRTPYRLYFRGQNVTLSAPLTLREPR